MFRTFSHNVPDRPGLIVVAYQSRCLAHIHSHAHSSAHLRDKPLRRCFLLRMGSKIMLRMGAMVSPCPLPTLDSFAGTP